MWSAQTTECWLQSMHTCLSLWKPRVVSSCLHGVLLTAGRWAPDAGLWLQRSRVRGPAGRSRRPSRPGGWWRRSGRTAPPSAWAGGRSTGLWRTFSERRRTSRRSVGTKQWVIAAWDITEKSGERGLKRGLATKMVASENIRSESELNIINLLLLLSQCKLFHCCWNMVEHKCLFSSVVSVRQTSRATSCAWLKVTRGLKS